MIGPGNRTMFFQTPTENEGYRSKARIDRGVKRKCVKGVLMANGKWQGNAKVIYAWLGPGSDSPPSPPSLRVELVVAASLDGDLTCLRRVAVPTDPPLTTRSSPSNDSWLFLGAPGYANTPSTCSVPCLLVVRLKRSGRSSIAALEPAARLLLEASVW